MTDKAVDSSRFRANRKTIFLEGRLQVALNKNASKFNQPDITAILRLLTEGLKKELDKIDPKAYPQLIKLYSRDIVQLKKDKEAKERKSLKRQQEKLDLRRKELEMRAENRKERQIEKIKEQILEVEADIKSIEKGEIYYPTEEKLRRLEEERKKLTNLQTALYGLESEKEAE